MNIRQLFTFIPALTLIACGDKEPRTQTGDSTSVQIAKEKEELAQIADPDTSGTGRWTANTRSSRRDITDAATLSNIRTSSAEQYDRIVFDFATASLPNWHISYVEKPVHTCGSGEAMDISGHGCLEIRFTPCNAHDTTGHATMPWKAKTFTHRNLLEMKQSCDFEAVTTWVAGLRSPSPYRVMELQNPSRIVVDVLN